MTEMTLIKGSKTADPNAEDAVLERILKAWEQLKSAELAQRKTNQLAKQSVEAAEAAFVAKVEEPTSTSSSKADLVGKLRRVEEEWQTYSETKAKAKADRHEAALAVEESGKKLDDEISDSRQTGLVFDRDDEDATDEGAQPSA